MDGTDVVAIFEQVGRERVAQGVRRDGLGDSSDGGGLAHRALDDGFVDVMAPNFLGDGIVVGTGGREHPLPNPLAVGVGILAPQGFRQGNGSGARLQVVLVKGLDPDEVLAEPLDDASRENGPPGMACIMKKVTVAIRKIVNKAPNTLRT